MNGENKDNEKSYNVWWSDIERFAGLFFDSLNRQPENEPKPVIFNKKSLNEVKNAYIKNLTNFKIRAYGKDEINHLIDRHKIAALYIKSFLEISPFSVIYHKNQNRTEVQDCPNEYFSLELMFLILIAWNEKKTAPVKMDKNEIKWFIILLNHFKLDIKTLDVLSLAQIIYYIEDKYITGNV